uniref:Origin recognition complex subunit 3 n=1 Tax=Ditylenchus dipsaci TaxID=166011 RepID=A0A915D209_9BILA
MEDCFKVNKAKKPKQFGGKWNKQSILEFQKLSAALDLIIEECITTFYEPISKSICKLLAFEDQDTVPTLFVRGHCVSWNLLRKNIEAKHNDCLFIWVTPSDANPVNIALTAVKEAEDQDKKVRIDTFLAINTTTNFAAISERIGRLCSTSLNVLTLELNSPSQLADSITKELFLNSKGNLSSIQFAGDLLLLARRRYLVENYSLTEFRKCFILALINFCTSYQQSKKKDVHPHNLLQSYEHLLQGLSSLIQTSSETCSLESLLQLHYKIQTGEFFENEYLHLKNNSSKWKKEQWVARLRLLSKFLMNDEALQDKREACEDLIEHVSAPTENDENAVVEVPLKSKTKKTAADFLKNKQTAENKAKISEDQFKSVFIFLDDLFGNFLKSFVLPDLVGIDEDQKCLLRTSTTVELDVQLSGKNGQNPNCRNEDVCVIYQLLVNFNKECYTAELGDLFDAYKAIGIEDIRGCDLESRFFNAVGFLEYIGALQHVSDGVIRLLYLPSTTHNLFV